MELRKQERRAPSHIIIIAFTLYLLLQLCAAALERKRIDGSFTQSSVDNSTPTTTTSTSVDNSLSPTTTSNSNSLPTTTTSTSVNNSLSPTTTSNSNSLPTTTTSSSIDNSLSTTTSMLNLTSLIHEPISFRWRRSRMRRRAKRLKENLEFLIAHNAVRARLGEPPLSWDRELEAEARNFAKNNVNACKLIHIHPDGSGPFGENAFWGGRNHWKPAEVVHEWAIEDEFYNMESNTCVPGHQCGHYTQIVWKSTMTVGCGTINCTTGGYYALCLYTPPGNFIGEGPFGITRDAPPPDTDADADDDDDD